MDGITGKKEDGFVTEDEAYRYYISLGNSPKKSRELAQAFISDRDPDGSGDIDLNEMILNTVNNDVTKINNSL